MPTTDQWKLPGIETLNNASVPALQYRGCESLIANLRQKPSAYKWFYDHILGCVVGKNLWRVNKDEILGTTTATVGDEALALLLLENSWDCWVERVCVSTGLEAEGAPEESSYQNLRRDGPVTTKNNRLTCQPSSPGNKKSLTSKMETPPSNNGKRPIRGKSRLTRQQKSKQIHTDNAVSNDNQEDGNSEDGENVDDNSNGNNNSNDDDISNGNDNDDNSDNEDDNQDDNREDNVDGDANASNQYGK